MLLFGYLTYRKSLTAAIALGVIAAPLLSFGDSSRCVSLSRTLVFGSSGSDVIALQQFLIAQNLLPAGSAVGTFGRLTQKAVQAWQSAHGIVSAGSPGTTGYGAVGSKTRRALSCSESSADTNATSVAKLTSTSTTQTSVSSSALGGLSQLTELLKKTQQALNDFVGYRVDGATLQEQKIDLKAIVLVRCKYESQYFWRSTQPEGEIGYSLGSGVIVSPTGYILTAGHVMRDKTWGTDYTGRTWNLDACEIIRTSDYTSLIDAQRGLYSNHPIAFEPVDIVNEAASSTFRGSAGLDVAVLKLKGNAVEQHYIRPFPDMVNLPTNVYSVTAIGYPGKDVTIPQSLERFDGVFVDLSSLSGSTCEQSRVADVCGWRYLIGRLWDDVQKYEGYYTEYGIESSQARGGFSGGPAYFKGYLIGLVTHGHSRSLTGTSTESRIDLMEILSSRDIVQYLQTQGISL